MPRNPKPKTRNPKKTAKRLSAAARARAKRVRLIVMDVDGVLTDGRLFYGVGAGDVKAFHALDGHGIKMAQRAGLLTAIISGRKSEAVAERARELQVSEVHQRSLNKLEAYEEILARHGLTDEQVACIGDDLVDIPLLLRAGLAVAVPNGDDEVKRRAHYVTRRAGGEGAVREVIDLILEARGLRAKLLERYLSARPPATPGTLPPAMEPEGK